MLGQGGSEVIKESDCGYAVPPGDYKALADVILNKVLPFKHIFEEKGKNGRNYFEKNYTLDNCINHIEEIIESR